MNVLIISPFFSPNIGGVETHLDDLCSFLSSRGHAVQVVTYQPLTVQRHAPKKEVKAGLTIYRQRWFFWKLVRDSERLRVLELPLLFPGLFLATLTFLLRNSKKVDIIHSHGFVAGSIANLLSSLFRKRYVVSVHWIIGRGRLDASRPLLARLMSRAQFVLTLSRVASEEMAVSGFPRGKIRHFRYWVDSSRFQPLDKNLCRISAKVEGQVFVLFVGRLVQEKGVMTVLEIAKMFESRRNVEFGIIGTGPLEGEIQRFCESHRNLKFFGAIPNDRLSIYYNAADLVLVPSVHEEGFGRVIIEALSCGTPVLASNRGGIPEALDKTVGIICDADSSSIAGRLDFLLNNLGILESLARNCRDFSVRNYGTQNALAIEQAYDLARR